MRDFEGKVAVVTGAASGIGLGLATRFAQEGMKVVLADVEEPALDAAVLQLQQAEHQVIGVRTDVSDPAAVEALAQQTIDEFGKVHILCNNAGVGGGRGLLWESSLKDWQWLVGVNFWGVLHGVRTFVPIMLAQGEEGHVVNTASLAGVTAGAGIYGVTKHAVVSLSESLYLHLRMIQAKVGVSALCPGFVRTKILDAARNRPAELQHENEEPLSEIEEMIRSGMEKAVQGGLPPAQVAEMVLDGVRNERFWILTTREFDEAIRGRMEGILQRSNPEMPQLG
jgi:NAD(P)-dependent dehydrogenase (short-subunit alcohol dehydrogenase family)